jgi:hypothetical protein
LASIARPITIATRWYLTSSPFWFPPQFMRRALAI